jgi:hypothetical protein
MQTDRQIRQISTGTKRASRGEKNGDAFKNRDRGLGETSKSAAPARKSKETKSLSQRIWELKNGGAGSNPTRDP